MTKTEKQLSRLVAKKIKMDETRTAAIAIDPHALNPQFWQNLADTYSETLMDIDETVRAVKDEREVEENRQRERERKTRLIGPQWPVQYV